MQLTVATLILQRHRIARLLYAPKPEASESMLLDRNQVCFALTSSPRDPDCDHMDAMVHVAADEDQILRSDTDLQAEETSWHRACAL